MKTSKEIVILRNAISAASCSYHNAIAENLRESGKEFDVEGEDEYTEGLRLEVLNCDEGSDNMVIDKVRWNGHIECHSNEENYEEHDEWFDIDYLGDAAEYVYDNIIWGDEDEEEDPIKDITDWAARYGNDTCINRLLSIIQDQWKIADIKQLSNELWEWDH